MVCGGLDKRECHVAQPLGVIGTQGPVDCDALLHGGCGKALRRAIAVGRVGERRVDLRQVADVSTLFRTQSPIGF